MNEKITIDQRKYLQISTVKEVNSFGSSEVRVTLGDGARMIVKGYELKITNFSKESGAFSLEGEVLETKILKSKDKFIKRFFK